MTESVDLDRLADYVGGALDGTPQADAVARLIAEDPRWAAAASALADADALVRADLAALAAGTGPMPVDVATRIDGALAGAVPPLWSVPDERTTGGTVVSLDQRRHRRLRRWTAVAAAVVALGVGVVTVLPKAIPSSNGAGTAAPGVAAARSGGSHESGQDSAAGIGPQAALPGVRVESSGTDYRRDSLPTLSNRVEVPGAAPPSQSGKSVESGGGASNFSGSQTRAPSPVAPDLWRLQEPNALKACLGAITNEYGGTVTLVDFARFEGRPAVLVVLSGANGRGRLWAVFVGPNCGLGGAITDELFNGPAG
jgi:hypothetical protein